MGRSFGTVGDVIPEGASRLRGHIPIRAVGFSLTQATDRILGCLKGIATGDAVGKQTETLSHEDVRRWYPHGIHGSKELLARSSLDMWGMRSASGGSEKPRMTPNGPWLSRALSSPIEPSRTSAAV